MTAQTDPAARLYFDLSLRVKLRVTGADRVRFLNGQITNDIRKATQSRGVEACVLNAKGKMDAHIFVHADGDSYLIDADPALGSSLQARLERYIIADDVQVEDVTSQLSIFHVIASETTQPTSFPGSGGLQSADVEKNGRTGNRPTSSITPSSDRFGRPGLDIWCEASRHDQIFAELAKKFTYCDPECAEQLRIEQGIPRWGRELTPEIIPVEANLEDRCIDYEKGCYIGQETISRMKMSGQRNKQLCGLVSLNDARLGSGMRLAAGTERKEAGWITSATRSGDREIALGYVKRGFNSAGTKLEVLPGQGESGTVQVTELPFSH
jgi:tRNA-modifying protein YgfZ